MTEKSVNRCPLAILPCNSLCENEEGFQRETNTMQCHQSLL